MKKIKRWIMICLVFCILFGNTQVVQAYDIKTTIAREVLDLYANSMVTGEVDIYDDIFEASDRKEFFLAFMEWRVAIMDILDVGYSDFEYTINNIDVSIENDSVILLINFNEIHNYINGAGTGSSNNLILGVDIDNLDTDYKVENIYLINDEFYDYFVQQTQVSTQDNIVSNTRENVFDTMIKQLQDLKDEMDTVQLQQKEYRSEDEIDIVEPFASGYSYSGSRGAAYAKKYVSNANSYFYNAGNDCTNFVSQCIWAAYGGWTSSMSNATMASNISNKVRMTSAWYAGSGGGSSAWENVDGLWNYAVGNTGNGPKAYGHNNGGYYTNILPIDMCVGDVLQKSNDGKDYFHSMYIISTPGGSSPSYSEIVIAQHTSNTTKTVAEVLVTTTYLRHMQFKYTTF